MNAAEKEVCEWLKDFINDCLYNERKMSNEEVKKAFKKANDEFYSLFGQNVFEVLKKPNLNELFKPVSELPGEYMVVQIYKNIVCDIIFGE